MVSSVSIEVVVTGFLIGSHMVPVFILSKSCVKVFGSLKILDTWAVWDSVDMAILKTLW